MRKAVTILELYSDGTAKKYSAAEYHILPGAAQLINEIASYQLPTRDNEPTFYKLVETLGFTKVVKYTPKRAKQLRARLKSFQETDLLKAAQAIKDSPFMQGENAQAKRYGTIDYLLRNDELIDGYIQDGREDIDLSSIAI